ncbi:MAG: FG-GAP repeat protein [Nitrospira sp.]|nr:FG-GAP repeat protein [Nitrospira sp.]
MKSVSPFHQLAKASLNVGLLAVMGGLVACADGGGGIGVGSRGSFARPAAPLNVILTPTAIKTFHFTWEDVTGETEYRLLEEPVPGAGFSTIASLPADTTDYDHIVFLPLRVNAQYIVQACNSAGCTDSAPVSVSDLLPAVGHLTTPMSQAGAFFGFSVALSGDSQTLAVGAPLEDSAVFDDSGAVYVFVRNGSNWNPQAELRASSPGTSDWLGFSLALSEDGNTLAVGVPLADHGAIDSGAVRVFVRAGGVWTEQAVLTAATPEAGEQFGTSLSLSADGHTLAVGAPRNDVVAPDSGATYLFSRAGSIWTQQTVLKAGTPAAGDQFGTIVSLSADGRTLAVGAPFTDSAGLDAGVVHVFAFDGSSWIQESILLASNAESNDQFGLRVALSPDGQTLAVGAPFEDSAALGVNGDQNNNLAPDSGAVYLFTRSGGTWTQQAYVKASNTEADDWFGAALAFSADGSTLAVGALQEDSRALGINGDQTDNGAIDSGAVYVFTRIGNSWTQQAYVKASNTEAGDWFGVSLSLSADGHTLIVGAPLADSGAFDSGAAFLY